MNPFSEVYRCEAPGVYRAIEDPVVVTPQHLKELRTTAAELPLKRARLNLHSNNDSIVHEMILAMHRDTIIPAHRHVGKCESFHLIEGSLLVVLFNDDGGPLRWIRLAGCEPRDNPYFRIGSETFHTVLPLSESVIFHETTNGPFDASQTEVAAFFPDLLEEQIAWKQGLIDRFNAHEYAGVAE